MKYYRFSDYVVGVSSKTDVLSAINAYFCLVVDSEYLPTPISEDEGYKLAIKEGYKEESFKMIEEDEKGLTVALLRRF